MRFWLLAALLMLSACAEMSHLWQQGERRDPVVEEVAVTGSGAADALWPERSVGQLLLDRQVLCQADPAPPAPGGKGIEAQLDALLLATCRPDATPGLLNQLIADLSKAGTWPAEYAGFFDLLLAGQKAYGLVEKMYNDLKVEHEETIRGLGEIEADLELQGK